MGGFLLFSPTVWVGSGGSEEGHTHRNTQERTRKCCTYPLATYPLKSARSLLQNSTLETVFHPFPKHPLHCGFLQPLANSLVKIEFGRSKCPLQYRMCPFLDEFGNDVVANGRQLVAKKNFILNSLECAVARTVQKERQITDNPGFRPCMNRLAPER